MPVSRGLREIMGAFGPMLDAALAFGRGAAQMWQTLENTYAAIGTERPHYATLQDMNTFRAGLGGFTRSVAAFDAATDQSFIGPELWTHPIGYEGTASDFAAPSMLATFESQIETGEGVVTRWSSVSYNSFFPQTVGELRADATAAVQEQLDVAATDEGEDSPTAGGQMVGIGRMYLVVRGL